VCVCVCVYVRHAQKIAKLFFERAKHAVPFQINYIIHKKIYQPLGPQNTPLEIIMILTELCILGPNFDLV
jgi:hypothetical protein